MPMRCKCVPSQIAPRRLRFFAFCGVGMDRWVGKVAVVTGASVGVGPAIVQALVDSGMNVVGISRKTERIEEQAKRLCGSAGKLHPLRCDVTREEDLVRSFRWVTETLGHVHVLINNAGWNRKSSLADGAVDEWRRVFDINVMALCMATREAVKIMREHDVEGHVIHMNSVFGQRAGSEPGVYAASKFAVTALAETLKQELKQMKSKVKVTSVSIGACNAETEEGEGLRQEDVAEAILYVLSTNPSVQVDELTIRSLSETV